MEELIELCDVRWKFEIDINGFRFPFSGKGFGKGGFACLPGTDKADNRKLTQ